MNNGRPQDVGRTHARTRKGGPADRALVERYYASMRSWLGRTLDTLEGEAQPDGLHGPVKPKMPTPTEAGKLWDLAMKLGRELGAEIDPDPLPDAPAARVPARPRKADYG